MRTPYPSARVRSPTGIVEAVTMATRKASALPSSSPARSGARAVSRTTQRDWPHSRSNQTDVDIVIST